MTCPSCGVEFVKYQRLTPTYKTLQAMKRIMDLNRREFNKRLKAIGKDKKKLPGKYR